jgi:hypothetical protein
MIKKVEGGYKVVFENGKKNLGGSVQNEERGGKAVTASGIL